MMKRGVMTAFVLVLGACVPEPDPRYLGPPVPAPGADACGAAELEDMVGGSRRVLETIRFATPVRIIEPGQPVTQDFSPARLNILIGEDGTIASISCG
jgi:Peptidase inhibitor I78 family